MAGPVTLRTSLAGIELATPVMAASGTFGSGAEMANLIDLRKVGAVVTKSITPQPVRGMPTPRMAETPSGMLNAIGIQNPGVEAFVEKDGPFIARAGVPVIVSIAGKTVQEYAEVAVRVSKIPGVVAVEANISSPNYNRNGQLFARDPQASGEVIGTVTRMTHLPVFAKLTADVTDIVEVAQSCIRAGAHGLSLINTLSGMSIDVETFRPRLGGTTGGLSGPAIRPVALRCVFQVARALPEVPIIGIGGITDAESAVEFLLAGAAAVQVGTANYYNPHATVEVAEGLAAYLARRGMTSPADLRGRVVTPAGPSEPAYHGG
ncbi:MAG TPA: dihydroorotate dehydrogenase [Actinomycetota bacterium]|nr:dihydroorotate dehydrogenase [Actinomycetota bacterium]